MKQTSQTGAKPDAPPIVLAYSGGLDTSFLVAWVAENYRRPVITVTVDTGVGKPSFGELLADTYTDGILVMQGGRIVFEQYLNGLTEDTPHLLMSVSKSVTSAVGALA